MVNCVRKSGLINEAMIPYNPIIRSLKLLHTHKDSERTLRTLIKKEPDALSFPGQISGSFYILFFQAIAHIQIIRNQIAIATIQTLLLSTSYPQLNTGHDSVCEAAYPYFVDPIICWVSICATEQLVLCHLSVSNCTDSNSMKLGNIKIKNSRG